MKLWISGEIDSIVSDSFRVVRNYIEKNINNILASNNYGDGVLSWDVIVVISKDKGKEVFKYNKKNKETDIHVILDIDRFKTSDSLGRKMLLLDSLIYSVERLSTLGIYDFNNIKLKNDLHGLKEIIFNQHAN
ncbi:hypothetical protein DBR43_33065 [Pedobacter sp. KBW06]|uniref:Imm44 family immunity protein n=1 Tax=Pedobacter sp. KBW06 TaxID=2153359 RepID=UPI000F5ACB78|nr:Imm44 family immunity protein [Pedobacter sp. KBW06]RQO64365.1 hypothetical protein DBR43_33065 [Pedobacter sp. KBW06]